MKRFNVLQSLAVLFVFSQIAWGTVPRLINFQGVLKDANGQPVADGPYPVKFEIFNSVGPGGGCLWEENQSVTTQGGLFSVILGSNSQGIPDSAFSDSARWLAVTVGNDPEISPRQRLVSVGYSYRVNSVDGAQGGNIYGDVTFHGNIIGSTPWTAFPFNGPYNDYVVAHGGDWQTVQYRKIGDIVYLRGKIHKVDHSMFQEGETFGILPPGFRPPAQLTFSPSMGPEKNVVQITSDGLLIFKQHDGSSETFSLDDIFFSTSP